MKEKVSLNYYRRVNAVLRLCACWVVSIYLFILHHPARGVHAGLQVTSNEKKNR